MQHTLIVFPSWQKKTFATFFKKSSLWQIHLWQVTYREWRKIKTTVGRTRGPRQLAEYEMEPFCLYYSIIQLHMFAKSFFLSWNRWSTCWEACCLPQPWNNVSKNIRFISFLYLLWCRSSGSSVQEIWSKNAHFRWQFSAQTVWLWHFKPCLHHRSFVNKMA